MGNKQTSISSSVSGNSFCINTPNIKYLNVVKKKVESNELTPYYDVSVTITDLEDKEKIFKYAHMDH
jgi:hypothetical protein